MEDQCAAANWTQYHVGGGSFVPWYHYPAPASFLQPHQVHHPYGFVVPQEGYGHYQPELWNYQTCAWPDTSRQVNEQVASAVWNKVGRLGSGLEVEKVESGGDCHDTLPMDISPSASPALSISTRSPTKSTISNTGSELKSEVLCSSPKKPCVLNSVQFSTIDLSEASSSVLSLLAKCNACMKKMLAQARGTNVSLSEPCTCSIKQEKAADPQNKPGSAAMYEPSKVRTYDKDSLMKHKPKAITINDMREEPQKRVVVQRVNGVARLFALPTKSPMPDNLKNVQARNTAQGTSFETHEGLHGPSSAEFKISEHCLKQKSTSSKDPRKASSQMKTDCAKKFVAPSKAASECTKSSCTSAQPVSEHKDGRARRRRQRRRKRAKDRCLFNAAPPVLTGVSPCDTEQSVSASKGCSLPQSAHLVSTDAELSTSTTCARKIPSSEVSHSAEESTNNSLETLGTKHSPTNRCSIDTSSCQMSQDKPVKSEREECRTSSDVCAGHIDSSTCIGEHFTDVVVGGNVAGVYYAPGAVIDRVLITSIEMRVDPKLGGCTERVDEPFSLVSQAEKLDEGWIWSFE
ncbi:uncharacterized protein LOC119396054 [Rhipicephalus sanguineus]|uniref:uncharacterized protein LOC119396054 n=1 Tax=Rhipicephalus sanguineus TaxID=34632 RepID=UPI001893975E|nr:uncharacterized protein LOC119396054 [Rhipicephalus sanguineus]